MGDDTKLLVVELAKDVRELSGHVLEIKETLAERRGERRVAIWLAGVVGGAAASIFGAGVKLAGLFMGRHG